MLGDAPPALPDFLGIGALKAGTSYLDAMLRSHPELSLPLHLKEVEFFSRHHERGLGWYAAQFAAPDGRPRGEISPQYLFDPACPARIEAANPGTKLLVSVRNPVDRAYSQYRHWVQETRYRGDFEQFLTEHPGAIERSSYWTLLQRYRDRFPDEQLHIVVFEEMTRDPATVLAGLYRFLGVAEDHDPGTMFDAVNSSGTPRFPRLYAASKQVSRWLYDHGQAQRVEAVKRVRPQDVLRGRSGDGPGGRRAAASTTGRTSTESADSGGTAGATTGPGRGAVERIAAATADDVAALSAYVGRDLSATWPA